MKRWWFVVQSMVDLYYKATTRWSGDCWQGTSCTFKFPPKIKLTLLHCQRKPDRALFNASKDIYRRKPLGGNRLIWNNWYPALIITWLTAVFVGNVSVWKVVRWFCTEKAVDLIYHPEKTSKLHRTDSLTSTSQIPQSSHRK